MAVTAPKAGAHFTAALAFQGAKGTPASVPATRVPVLVSPRPANTVTVDPQGFPAGGFQEARLGVVALLPRLTARFVAEPTTLAILLESVTAGTPVTGGGTTTFAWQHYWSRFLTLWVDDGSRAVRWSDAVVTRLRVSAGEDDEPLIAEADLAASARDVLATTLGATLPPTPAQWSHAASASAVNSEVNNPTRLAFEVVVGHELRGGMWGDTIPGLPENVIRHVPRVFVEAEIPPSDEAAARAADGLTAASRAAEWSWTRNSSVLRLVAPRTQTSQGDLFGLGEGGDAESQRTVEEIRGGPADADVPATITLES